MGPIDYAAGEAVGAPDHPHRGFETVTYVLAGKRSMKTRRDIVGDWVRGCAVDDRWSRNRTLQMPSARFSSEGGRMHGFQIWVNLPARDKMIAPRYQRSRALHSRGADCRRTGQSQGGGRGSAGRAGGDRDADSYQLSALDVLGGTTVSCLCRASMQPYVYVFEGAVRILIVRLQMVSLPCWEKAMPSTFPPQDTPRPCSFPECRCASRWCSTGPFVMNTTAEIPASR